ncbi:MAG TPA: valine--tRNA ligase [Gemmatimonadales bacterium]
MTDSTLAPQYDPRAIEGDIYRRWVASGAFAGRPDSPAAPYVIVMPPPNVTDRLHMGHGFVNTLQDALIRFERMRGRDACWMPGTDHAGIATQNVVERLIAKDGKRRQDLGREAFVERVKAYVAETGTTILTQLEAIGASCDWSRTRYTLDEAYSNAVRKVFVQLHQEGLVYRGHRVIHWCPRCLTSLSDEEAEFRDVDGMLYFIQYRLARPETATGQPVSQSAGHSPAGDGVVVATTRPETMFGDVAVVYNPKDERFKGLAGQRVTIPLTDVPIPIMTHRSVEKDFGTGMLKITPAHDMNDFDIARDILPDGERPIIMTEDARMADLARVPQALRGLDRVDARKKIVKLLEAQGLLVKTEPHRHAVRHCYRCDTVVEPRLSDQWFVKMKPLAEPALNAYRAGQLTFVPERWGSVYERWLVEIRDWNISRQLWWGHRVPAWYCGDKQCGHITVSETDAVACEKCGGKQLTHDEDVLDTWFSSWLWPFATFGWPEKTPDLARYYPGHTLVTGPDIIFLWVSRMVMGGYHFLGERPFATVFLNGIVRDTKHQKMSKSKGNGIDPLEVVAKYGADALRYTMLAGSSVGTDVILDPADLETSFGGGRNFANKIWNLGRFILSSLDNAETPELDPAKFELADRWILSRTERVVADATQAMERFRINDAAGAIYHFLWDDLADWYIEQVKPRLYGDLPNGETARGVLRVVFATALKLLHPIMPFITEALWARLPTAEGPNAEDLLIRATWPKGSGVVDAEAEGQFARVQALVSAVRNIRAEYGVPPGQAVRLFLQPNSRETMEAVNAEQRTIERLANVSQLAIGQKNGEVGAHGVLPDGSALFVPLGDAIDVKKECDRLGQEMARMDQLLVQVAGKLANAQFTERAPKDVVEKERVKEQSWREQREALAAKLRVLGC